MTLLFTVRSIYVSITPVLDLACLILFFCPLYIEDRISIAHPQRKKKTTCQLVTILMMNPNPSHGKEIKWMTMAFPPNNASRPNPISPSRCSRLHLHIVYLRIIFCQAEIRESHTRVQSATTPNCWLWIVDHSQLVFESLRCLTTRFTVTRFTGVNTGTLFLETHPSARYEILSHKIKSGKNKRIKRVRGRSICLNLRR